MSTQHDTLAPVIAVPGCLPEAPPSHGLAQCWRAAIRSWLGAALRQRPDDLSSLDDRTLRDIGLTRGEIPSVKAELLGLAAPTRRGVLAALIESGRPAGGP